MRRNKKSPPIAVSELMKPNKEIIAKINSKINKKRTKNEQKTKVIIGGLRQMMKVF